MKDLIIIGSGPAGISAALYAARAGLDTLVVSQGAGALEKAEQIENYYGAMPMTGAQLHETGMQQAKALGVSFVQAQALGVSGFDTYTVSTTAGDYAAAAVLLATGAKRAAPPVAGLKALEGRGVSYCAVCDAFFYRGKRVGVLGSGPFAVHEADHLAGLAASVTILTNGAPETFFAPPPYPVERRPIAALTGQSALEGVTFQDGDLLLLDGLFVALGATGSAEIARQLGAELSPDGRICVDDKMQTTLPGLFAAGDCTGGMLQVAKAVYEGAQAGMSAIAYIRARRAAP